MAKLYFHYGAMNSGKTTALMQVAFNYEERGMQVLVLKPAVDTKGAATLLSRIGVSRPVDALVDSREDLFDLMVREKVLRRVDCVLVDEAQFLTPAQADQLFRVAVLLDIPVICYGLRTDFMLRGFPGSTRLLEIAHSLQELKTICRCGRKAVVNARLVDGEFVFSGEQLAIDGGNVTYEPLCAECYFRIKEKHNAGAED